MAANESFLIIHTFDEIKRMKEYALQKSTNIQEQTLLNYLKVANRLELI